MDSQQQELINNLIVTIYDKVLLPYLKKLRDLAKEEIEKIKIDWNQAFKNYLSHSYEKYSKIKTLLFKSEPKYIYEFFEPPLLSYNGKTITTDNVATIFQDSRFLIIKGEGGMGKSTLLKHFFINTIQMTEQIPIFLELLEFNDSSQSIDIFKLLNQKLSNLDCSLDNNLLEYALKSGCFIFFLDGYDELIPERRDSFFSELDSFCDKYSNNYYVMTSRPFSDFVEFQRFTVLTCERLTKEQAISLITKIEPYDEKTKSKFISDLNKTLYESHYHFASNPLLLNIMFLTYDNYAELPVKRHVFYDYAYETMYQRHDATKGTYKRSFKSGIPSDRFKKIVACFSFIVYSKGKVEMSKDEVLSYLTITHDRYKDFDVEALMDDLLNAVCILIKEGLVYKFIHRSFQEYFVANFLLELPDENFSSIVDKLVQSTNNEILLDDVLPMLADKAPERFENSILIPYLQNIEKQIDSNTPRFEQYYDILYGTVKITCMSGTVIGFAVSINDWFLIRMAEQYNKFQKSMTDYSEISRILINSGVITEDQSTKNVINYSLSELKIKGLYEALKSTWVGANVITISRLLGELEEKQKRLWSLTIDLSSI